MKIWRIVNISVYKKSKKQNFVLDSSKEFKVLTLKSKDFNNIYVDIFNILKKSFLKYNKHMLYPEEINIDIGCIFGKITISLDYDTLKDEYLGLYRLDKDLFFENIFQDIRINLKEFIINIQK